MAFANGLTSAQVGQRVKYLDWLWTVQRVIGGMVELRSYHVGKCYDTCVPVGDCEAAEVSR